MSVVRSVILLAAMLLPAAHAAPAPLPRIAIIVDDLGYQRAAGERALRLPGAVTYAILPQTPSAAALAQLAHLEGKEVLLHLPLESVGDGDAPQPGGITLQMSRDEFHAAFSAALDSVPHAVGVSNHRGSLLTRHPGHMGWLMEEIAAHEGMFFVDSFTTHQSIAMQLALEAGIATTRRHVFLDNDRSPAALSREFERLTAIARRQGVAVAICHPYPETLAFLEQKLIELDDSAVQLVPVSQALAGIERGAPGGL